MRLPLAALAVIASFASTASAGIVFHDDFNSTTLDPAWNVSFKNATGWNYSVPSASDTDLVVTDIFGVPPQLNGGNYGIVSLARSFGPITDFQLQFDFAWDSGGTLRAMQYVEVSLYDANNILIVSSGYQDGWVASRGSAGATIGGTVLPFVADSMPLAGSASVSIERYGSAASVSWNGQQILSGSTAAPAVSARVSFGFFNYPGEGPFNPSSTFGSESVDLIRLSSPDVDAAVPEPASLAIWLVGAFGVLAAVRFKRFASSSAFARFALLPVCVLWLSCLTARPASAAIVTITSNNLGVYADDWAVAGDGSSFDTATALNRSNSIVATNGASFAQTTLSWTGDDQNASLFFSFGHTRAGANSSFAQTYETAVRFIATQGATYTLDGRYGTTGGQQGVYSDIRLRDLTSGTILFHDLSYSQFTSREFFLLGTPGDGDTLNTTTGSLTGSLVAGRTYELFFTDYIQARFDDDGASASGLLRLSIQSIAAPVPEPASLAIWVLAGTAFAYGTLRRRLIG